MSSYDVAGELEIDHETVLAHLKKAGYTKKLDIWVPHELTEKNLINRVLICDSLLRRNETVPFLKKLITGDEKWITYDKNVRKRSWSKAGQASQTVAKPGLTRNKVMLCKWWDWKSIILYELLPVRLTSREDCQNHLSLFFDQKPQNFYSNGITSIPTRWQKVIQQNGTYIL
ncbi:hypothetical protein K1T71_007360 [Dendrolimus kikuchii]|uniref:Uncharacterized protein n=1 Tax=Dendrolimus kikuchii TaxID=765133 RepID=A0ACC1D0I7_9NEOP|nr:hypothetical protein K1T71_007360 [Dendrolimus kikuchii]